MFAQFGQPAKMHSRNFRSNSSASANHIWLKALYFSRNPGKAVASTRHRKVDFHHFSKLTHLHTICRCAFHLKLHLSLGRSSANCGRNAYGFCTSRRPSICVITLFTKDCLYDFIWLLIGVRRFLLLFSNLLFRYKECTSVVLHTVCMRLLRDVPCTNAYENWFSQHVHHTTSIQFWVCPWLWIFASKKFLSNKLAKTWVGINQGHVTARNIIRTFVSSLTTFEIQIRIRQPVLTRPCNYIVVDIKLDLQRRWWQPGTPCIANAKTVSSVKMSKPRAKVMPH